MANLLDFAIDLINDAKGGKDPKAKLFALEQVKEIVLYRDQTILMDVFPSIMDFMREKSNPIRKFLIRFAGEVFAKTSTVTPTVLGLYSFIVDENSEAMIKLIAMELKSAYDKMVIHIVNLPPIKQKSLSAVAQIDPKDLWAQLSKVVRIFTEAPSSDKSEIVRIVTLRFIESVIVFGLPPPAEAAKVLDPRLLAAKRGSQPSSSASEASVADIPLQHAFINRNDIEKEAEALLSKLLLWANRGGPSSFPFSPALMSVLGQVIAGIATARPKFASNAIPAIIQVMQGRGEVCAQMSGQSRESLARAVHRLTRALSGREDDATLGKLRAALAAVEQLGFTDSHTDEASSVTGKRGRDELDDEGDADEEAQKSLRASVVAAVDASESLIRVKAAASTAAETSVLGQSFANANATAAPVIVETELATSLAELHTLSSNLKLVQVVNQAAAPGQLVLRGSNAASPLDCITLKPLASTVSSEMYSHFALESLLRMLTSFEASAAGSQTTLAKTTLTSFSKLIVRTVLSLASMEISGVDAAAGGAWGQTVQVIVSAPPASVSGKLMEGLATEVAVPRSIWLLLSSFLLSRRIRDDERDKVVLEEYMKLIKGLLLDLYGRYEAAGSPAEGEILLSLYDNVCLVLLSRMLQNLYLRTFCRELFGQLYFVPKSCIRLLRLLVYTGSRTTSAAAQLKHDRESRENKSRGICSEALFMLVALISGADESASLASLHVLLWCCLAEDIKLRTDAITCLLDNVLPEHDWAFEIASTFSLQAISTLVGADTVVDTLSRIKVVPALSEAEDAKAEDKVECAVTDGEGMSGEQPMDEEDCVEEDAENMEEDVANVSVTLLVAAQQYDAGKSFGGSFTHAPLTPASKVEAHIRRHFHLLLQLCVSSGNASLIKAYFDFGLVLNEDVEVSDSSSCSVPATAEDATAAKELTKVEMLRRCIRTDMAAIIPAVVAHQSPDLVFSALADVDCSHPNSFALMELVVSKLHSDFHLPASASMIASLKVYIRRHMHSLSSPDDLLDLVIPSSEGRTPWLFEGIDCRLEKVIRLLLSILGGCSAADIETLLPYVLRSVGHDAEMTKIAMDRIVQARPPPMTRSALLVVLHRISPDNQEFGFKQKIPAEKLKMLNNCIRICLENPEFTSEVLKEALNVLLADAVPVQSIMRTVILSYGRHSDLKKFVHTEVIPSMIRKKIWAVSKGVWDGVVVAIKALASSKDAEVSLRAVLCLPSAQLQFVLKLDSVKPHVVKVLKALSVTEREEVVSGAWVGIQQEGNPEESSKKKKIIEDLLA